ncbi:unnamed protein product [Sphagnum tenellum]
MERLEEEICHLLAQNSRYVDPDWLFDSMAVAGSFRSSFNDDHHHIVDDAAAASEISSSGEEDAARDEDKDVFPMKTLACSREWLRMREAKAVAPPPKRLRLSIKCHRLSLPPPIPKDLADIPATSAIDHLSGGSSRKKFLAASSQHGPSPSPSTTRGELVDNAGDVCCTVDKFVATSPLSSDGFGTGSLAAEEICLYVDVLPQLQISDPQKLLLLVLFQAQEIFQSFFSSANSELLEYEPNAPSDAKQLDDVNNIAAMAPITNPKDPIPKAMSELLSLLGTVDNCQYDASYHADNEPMVQSNTAAWALITLVQEQQLTTPEVIEISDEERADNGTARVNIDIDDLGGGNGSEQLDDDDFHAPSTNADFAAFVIPAGSFKDMDSKPDQVSTQRPRDGEADVVTCPICMEAWTSIGRHLLISMWSIVWKIMHQAWLRQAGKEQGKCPQCNCRARVEDLRMVYVPRIAVIDGEG